jgi:short-subunit dehydrogenase
VAKPLPWLKTDGISVNELIPGPVDTSMTTNNKSEDSVFSIGGEWIKGREDIVPLALFLGDTTHHRPDGAEF